MKDSDLENINLADIPPPSPGARKIAVNAAVAAFEKQKSKTSTKGNANTVRLMTSFMTTLWERLMIRRKTFGAIAAGLVLFPAASVLTWQHFHPESKLFNSSKPGISRNVAKREETHTDTKKLTVTELSSRQLVQKKLPLKPLEEAPIAEASRMSNSGILSITAHRSEGKVSTSLGAKNSDQEGLRNQKRVGSVNGLFNMYGKENITGNRIRPPVGRTSDMDKFTHFQSNPLKSVLDAPVSTFSIDVDTSSYSFVRRQLVSGRMPPKQQVRVEEMVNYFSYNYPRPESKDVPFQSSVSVFTTPWNSKTKLLHIGLKGYDIVPTAKPQSNLVFLIDVSGSMNSPDKLPLLKNAFRLLIDQLNPEDTISIVTYAGNAGTVLEPTLASNKFKILQALDSLKSGGSTAGAQGIVQAYALAKSAYKKGGINRVLLATDGDFNVGISDLRSLKQLIEQKRKSGIHLSVLGFGKGNYNDAIMQTLAQNGNGTAAYIDNLREAQKVLVEESSSTLFTIAKDVKIQIEFNPKTVSEYRLIGYETRSLNKQDFKNDKVDAGDIGSGHTVTAIYEITPTDSPAQLVDKLRYQKTKIPVSSGENNLDQEYAFLKMRYKLPAETKSRPLSLAVTTQHEQLDIDKLGDDIKFSTSVAAFGQKLRGNTYLSDYSFEDIISLARSSLGQDKFGYRHEFLGLVRLAKSLEIASLPGRSSVKNPKR